MRLSFQLPQDFYRILSEEVKREQQLRYLLLVIDLYHCATFFQTYSRDQTEIHNNNDNNMDLSRARIHQTGAQGGVHSSIAAISAHTGLIKHNNQLCPPHRYPFTPGWREAIAVKCLAQGHKAPWSWPGFEPTFWQLGHQNTIPMH